MSKKFIIPLMLLFFPLLTACGEEANSSIESSQTRSLYVFGDSWADQMDDEVFQQELADRGFENLISIAPFAIGGTTMQQWADDEEGILSEVLEEIGNDPNPNPIVFFTLSGNDLLGGGTMDNVLLHLRSLLTDLEASREDLQIIYAGYDILNVEVDPEQCSRLLNNLFGTADPALTNPQWLFTYELIAEVVNEFERATAVNTYGSLQGQPGNPLLDQWSNVDYLSDCIHLNDTGYGIYLDTVFDAALTPLICTDTSANLAECEA
ncbi:MAG: SGNH/GDSL hydrolase family protein [Chloroflexota bacterium]